jgi:hypothetical protein
MIVSLPLVWDQRYKKAHINVDHLLKSLRAVVVLFLQYLQQIAFLSPLETVSRVIGPNIQ